VVDAVHHGGRHLRDAHGDGLALGRHEHDLVTDVDVVGVAQQARDHDLGAVADGVDGRVLDDDALEAREQHLERAHDAARVALVLLVVEDPLRVEHVVHGHERAVLVESARAHAAQLLHVAARAEQQAEVHAERADVGARLARDPENGKVALRVELHEPRLVDGADAQLALDGRDERRPLEERARKRLDGAHDLGLRLGRAVEAHDGHVLLARGLLRLDEARGAVDADDEAARHLGVERAAVARLVDAQDALDPGHDLVRGGVGRLVEVDAAGLDVLREGALERRVARGDGRVVARAHVQRVVVLQQQRPRGRVGARRARLRLQHVLRRRRRRRLRG
jgi:hypothetical protein